MVFFSFFDRIVTSSLCFLNPNDHLFRLLFLYSQENNQRIPAIQKIKLEHPMCFDFNHLLICFVHNCFSWQKWFRVYGSIRTSISIICSVGSYWHSYANFFKIDKYKSIHQDLSCLSLRYFIFVLCRSWLFKLSKLESKNESSKTNRREFRYLS